MPKLLILLLLCCCATAYGADFISPLWQQETLTTSSRHLDFQLRHSLVVAGSDSLFVTDSLLVPGQDYQLEYRTGAITFSQPFGSVRIVYMHYPAALAQKAFAYLQQDAADTTRILTKKPAKNLFYSDTNLRISGSKTISISVSNTKDFNLDQSLYLRLNGKMSSNLNIEAQLSDSQTPITPEGDSREISNLDKIFIRLYGKQYELAFGDLEMQFANTRFINYTPKFEGLKASWFRTNSYRGAVAVAKGKKATSTIAGVEAKQGPYYLSQNISSGLQVVPGTETVFLDGKQMQRGDDYTIDYAEGSISFTQTHFITATSFIQVEYQFADEEYRQTMYLAQSEVHLTDAISLKASLISQVDDQDNPLLNDFDAADLAVLADAGDSQAWGNGIFQTDPGAGAYRKITTPTAEYYEYVFDDTTGSYNIIFSYVGYGVGTYQLSTDGLYYIYAGYDAGGNGLGEYLPQKLLPRPQSRQNYDLRGQLKTDWLSLVAETIASQYDQNTFSSSDDGDNNGFGFYAAAALQPQWNKLEPTLKLHYLTRTKQLSTFAQLNNPLDLYEFSPLPDSVDQSSYNAALSLKIDGKITPFASYAKNTANNYATQEKTSGGLRSIQSGWLPQSNVIYSTYRQDSKSSQAEDRDVTTHSGTVSYKVKKTIIKGQEYYKKQQETISLLEAGTKTRWQQISVATEGRPHTNGSASYKTEIIDSLQTPGWQQKIRAHTTSTALRIISGNHNADLQYSHRTVITDSTRNFDMAGATLRSSFWKKAIQLRTQYTMKNVEFYPKVRELEFVGDELGIYDSTGVVSENGEYDWVITAIDYNNPAMAVEINSSATLTLSPRNITKGLWSRIQWESYALVHENSTSDQKTKLYLLQPQVLMQEDTSIYSSRTLRNTLWLDLIRRTLSAKLKHQTDRTLDNRYNASSERLRKDMWQGSLQYQMPKRSSLECTATYSTSEDTRLNEELEDIQLNLDFRRSLNDALSSITTAGYTQETGDITSSGAHYAMDSYLASQQFTWLWARKYRAFARGEIRYNQRSGVQATSFFDKNNGLVTKWHLTIDYRMNDVTSLVVEYSGKDNPDDPSEQELRMEIKAEF